MKRLGALGTALGLLAVGCGAAAGPSPDERIGFVRSFPGRSKVLTIKTDGTDVVRVSQRRGRSTNPELSPDGTMLAYDRSFDLYVVDVDRSNRRLLSRNAYAPTWAPTGDKLTFSRYRVDSDVAIFSINADGTERRELTNGSINYEPAWSPDGSRMVFVRDRDLPQLWTMDADGSSRKRLTFASGREDSSPEWSPDGTKVVFSRLKAYGSRCLYKWDILVVNIDGSEVTNLTKTCGESEAAPHWSPDGSEIVFTQRSQIYAMNSDGTEVTRLTDAPGRNHSPVWSPDGTKIAFISNRDGNAELYVMNADGTAQTRLTRSAAGESQPTW